MVPMMLFNETLLFAFNMAIIRNVICLHALWCIQSVAHVWGTRPYDGSILSTENYWLSIYALGEGWHNYHHAFPWDFKASELGYGRVNLTTNLLLLFAKFGWIYDMKEASAEHVKRTLVKLGDGTHESTLQEVPYRLDNVD
jgi:stearoyl-CoA desaturase (delta-9 desaturase)